MIKYNLKCHNNHEFESWFSDSNEFDKLNKKKLLDCIYCSSKRISKSIMAPMVSVISEQQTKNNKMEKILKYVGNNFTKKVREVYYNKNNKKTIYGSTTPEEREELAEEGIDLLSIPWINKDN